jgi:hypothetical protein
MTSRRETARFWTGARRFRRRSTTGTARGGGRPMTATATRRSWKRSATSCPRAGISASRPRRSTPRSPRGGAAARGADHQCALRAERGQCALGEPLRRALRHRRDGLPAARRAAMTGGAARGSWRGRGCSSTTPSRSRGRAMRYPRRYRVEKGQLLADDKPLMNPRNSSATRGIRAGRTRSCCATTGCMWSWSSTGPIPSARATRRFWPMCGWRRRSPRSWIARIPSPASMPRTRYWPMATGWA